MGSPYVGFTAVQRKRLGAGKAVRGVGWVQMLAHGALDLLRRRARDVRTCVDRSEEGIDTFGLSAWFRVYGRSAVRMRLP